MPKPTRAHYTGMTAIMIAVSQLTSAGFCGPAFAPPPSDTCSGGQSARIVSAELSGDLMGTFRPLSEGDHAPYAIGGQGTNMIPVRMRVHGTDLPACLSQKTSVFDASNHLIVSLDQPLNMYPDAPGTRVSGPMYLVTGPVGSDVSIQVQIGSFQQTFHYATPVENAPHTIEFELPSLSLVPGGSAVVQMRTSDMRGGETIDLMERESAAVHVPASVDILTGTSTATVRIAIDPSAPPRAEWIDVDALNSENRGASIMVQILSAGDPADSSSAATLAANEVLAVGTVDASCDGKIDEIDDQFIELTNTSAHPIALESVTISAMSVHKSGVTYEFTRLQGTIGIGETLVLVSGVLGQCHDARLSNGIGDVAAIGGLGFDLRHSDRLVLSTADGRPLDSIDFGAGLAQRLSMERPTPGFGGERAHVPTPGYRFDGRPFADASPR